MRGDFLKKIKRAHFIGIGGIGVSAIARMMLLDGKKVSGSDNVLSKITEELKNFGAKIFKGQRTKNIKDGIDLVVYSPAVKKDNSELKEAKRLRIFTLSYPQVLGLISKEKYTIAVSGTHGKTTTTAMIAKILKDAGLDPTVIVGSLLKDLKSNFIAGKGKYFVCEACEYKKSFLNLHPRIIVITNIDNDHLDYYKNLSNIQKAFAQFASKLKENDYLICDKNDKNLKPVVKRAKCKIIDYSKIKTDFKLKIPGEHNIKNAKAALAVAKILSVNRDKALAALKKFSGTWRRFEYKGNTKNGVLVYDDYAHHPTEIRATLKAMRKKFKNKKIWCVFQPHLFSRTRLLLDDFAKSFNDVDAVIVSEIYAAREKDNGKINSVDLVNKIGSKAIYMGLFDEIEKFLKDNAKKGEIVITMGAGDVFKIGENLLK